MKYIRSERLTDKQVLELESMGFLLEVDSYKEIDGRKLYFVYAEVNHAS